MATDSAITCTNGTGNPASELVRRLMDITASALGLLLLGPSMVAVALVIKATSPGPVFYRGVRTGKDDVPFRIFKFRTMVQDAENRGGLTTGSGDPRVTRTGAFLRKYKLDELPQLLNVLMGQMSLVGPRPQVKEYTDLYTAEEKAMLSVKPGLTDYASIRFINQYDLLDSDDAEEQYRREIEPEKNRLRLKYVKERSLRSDLKILLLTALAMMGVRV